MLEVRSCTTRQLHHCFRCLNASLAYEASADPSFADMKFHVEHFTCSVCPTVFGPQDSYYEHAGSVYCHFHYSTRFAVKCTGCRTAILKQFVEINRNSQDEHWHPECYMIHKVSRSVLSVTITVLISRSDSSFGISSWHLLPRSKRPLIRRQQPRQQRVPTSPHHHRPCRQTALCQQLSPVQTQPVHLPAHSPRPSTYNKKRPRLPNPSKLDKS